MTARGDARAVLIGFAREGYPSAKPFPRPQESVLDRRGGTRAGNLTAALTRNQVGVVKAEAPEEGARVDDLDATLAMSIEVVYVDEHLIELAATVGAGSWRGRTTAYTVPETVDEFADALLRFADGGPPAAFSVGAETGIGLIGLRFYRIDRSGHIACHARLAAGGVPTHHRPEQVSLLAVEFGVETWAVMRFATELMELAVTREGRAVLALASVSG